MPRSKRSKLVSLTKVSKKTREHKNAMIQEVQANADKWTYCWLFGVGAMRNTHLKTVRKLWKDSARIFFGRGAVMAKALGTTAAEEHKLGLHKLALQIKGQVGLLFTNSEPAEVLEWFADFKQPDFARAGNVALKTVILPAGPVMQRHSDIPEPLPHNEDVQLRKLGLTTTLSRGVPTLTSPHKLCDQGKTLSAEQAQLLKLIGERMIVFRVALLARWDSTTGEVIQMEHTDIDLDLRPADNEGDDEDAMSE